ncbi:hypothetical protein [Bradyrhizobium liaoningense]
MRAVDVADAEPTSLRGPGRRTPNTRATIFIRDTLLVEAALLFHRGVSNSAAAAAIHRRLALYRAGGWRRHRADEQLPTALVGKIEELLWHLLKQHDALPSERTIRAGPGCLDSAPLDLSGFLPGYAERGALRFCRCVGRA